MLFKATPGCGCIVGAFDAKLPRIGLSGRSFHDQRHFFVSELFRMGALAEAIRIMTGHADLGTMQRYAGLNLLACCSELFWGQRRKMHRGRSRSPSLFCRLQAQDNDLGSRRLSSRVCRRGIPPVVAGLRARSQMGLVHLG